MPFILLVWTLPTFLGVRPLVRSLTPFRAGCSLFLVPHVQYGYDDPEGWDANIKYLEFYTQNADASIGNRRAARHQVNKMEMKQQFLKKAEETETLTSGVEVLPERYHAETHGRPKAPASEEKKVFSRYRQE